jgi:hypothetical protein
MITNSKSEFVFALSYMLTNYKVADRERPTFSEVIEKFHAMEAECQLPSSRNQPLYLFISDLINDRVNISDYITLDGKLIRKW